MAKKRNNTDATKKKTSTPAETAPASVADTVAAPSLLQIAWQRYEGFVGVSGASDLKVTMRMFI
jgi:hypothetical protein